jgi:2-keto-4-pentenoate hydratase/2-oxohepta-3-ene-1,7-dioic acid hydratase in catechol pathway
MIIASKIGMRYALAVRIVCFESDGRVSIGALIEEGVVDLAELLPTSGPQAQLEALIDGWGDVQDAVTTLCRIGPTHPLEAVSLRASVPAPGKVLCVMRNRPALHESSSPPWAYLKHADGGVGTDVALRLPAGEKNLHFAPEIAVVVRGPARAVNPDAWRDAVFGYTGFLDVVRPSSAFGPTGGDDWWKSWDTAFAVGPTIVTAEESGHPGSGLSLAVTGASGMVSARDPGQPSLGEIIAFISSVMTLHTGDLIACGAHAAAVLAAAPGSRAQLHFPGCGSLVVEAV